MSAARACVEAEIEPGRGAARHGEGQTFKDVVRLLGDVYWEVTGKVLASSVGMKQPGRPFVRFLLVVLLHLDDRRTFKTRHALRNERQRLKRSGVWKGLKPEYSPGRESGLI